MVRTQHVLLIIIIIGIVLATHTVIAQEENVADSLEDGAKSLWDRIRLPVIAAVLMFVFQGILYIINLFKKDRLLKTIMNKYVVFDMKNGPRYQGTMQFGNRGMEIVSEESRQRGQAPSYIFPNNTLQTSIRGYVRYIDTMNERELRERSWELERLLHPPISQRFARKIRNFFYAMNEAVKNAINMVWGGIRRAANPLQRQLQTLDTAAKEFGGGGAEAQMNRAMGDLEGESKAFLKEESYDTIIERLVGTRVKIRVEGSGEYMALLKDYNKDHFSFMNVKDKDNNGYKDEWQVNHEYKHNINNFNKRDDRGLRCRMVEDKQGRYFLVLENNTAYAIQIGKIILHDGSPNWERNLEFKHRVEPLSVRRIRLNPVANHRVGPFERVTVPEMRTPRNYKKIQIHFRSFRDADVIFPREKVCTIIESAEKHQQELFSISALTEALMDRSEKEEIAIQDAQGRPIHGMNLVHGYVTNVNEERLDIKSVDSSYSRRWEVESAYTHFDNTLRHRVPIRKRIMPFYAKRLVTQNALVEHIRENQLQKEAISHLAYPKKSKKRLRVPLLKLVTNGEIRLPLKVMVFTSNGTNEEYPIIEQFEYIQEHHMLYEPVDTLRNDRLAKMDILWIGNGEIYQSGYRLNIDAEHRIKNFVSQGGVVIVSGQDVKTNVRQRRGGGWIPEPLTGIEYDETDELLPTTQGRRSRIFHKPNMLNTTPETKEIPLVKLDDMWVDPLGKWNSLAKSTAQDASALLTLPFQQGLYIVTSLKNDNPRDVEINRKLMENLLHYSVKWLDNQKWKQRILMR
ncbi:hypothetical protein F4X73_01960 [Candidatus Poribacteria bacterium]|nr:hypothetical protein [Candidatus Poribacteria bacterium]MYB63431.1 hypothetical protein [Candidatus Poribacteria bacterium]MYF55932.1 hypothetical protein [Candidatus Poribacteria bacterium]